MLNILRRYLITLLFTAAIFTVCLIPVPETQIDDVSLIDKQAHMLMFFFLGIVFWTEYWRSRSALRGMRLFAAAVALPVAMGGLIELMQETLTDCRSGDWLDFAADAAGVVAGAAVGRYVVGSLFRGVRDKA